MLLNPTKFKKPKWDSKFQQNHHKWEYFLEKMVDSNFFFISVGRPNPDQYYSKSTLKSKYASMVKTGPKCHFFKRYLDHKT